MEHAETSIIATYYRTHKKKLEVVKCSSLRQFKVVQGFILPAMGPDPGVVKVVTKSGSNKVLFAALGQVSPQVYGTGWNNFSPRLGFAWQPKFWSGTVIRGGAGVYYPSQRALYQLFAIMAPGVSIVQ